MLGKSMKNRFQFLAIYAPYMITDRGMVGRRFPFQVEIPAQQLQVGLDKHRYL